MLTLPRSVQIYLATEPADMRRSIDGLLALVQHSFGHDAFSGHLYVFLSRRSDRVKILSWDKGGFVLYYKRLERGRFRRPVPDAQTGVALLDATQLSMLLDGIDVRSVPQPKSWTPPRNDAGRADSTR